METKSLLGTGLILTSFIAYAYTQMYFLGIIISSKQTYIETSCRDDVTECISKHGYTTELFGLCQI